MDSFEKELILEVVDSFEESIAALTDILNMPSREIDRDKLFRIIHTLKGNAHAAGFIQNGNLLQRFESFVAEDIRLNSFLGEECRETLRQVTSCIDSQLDYMRENLIERLDKEILENFSLRSKEKEKEKEKEKKHLKVNDCSSQSSTAKEQEADNKKLLKILVIDDDSDLRGILCSMIEVIFENPNYKDFTAKLYEAEDGKKALEMCKESTYDLVITDYQMPNLSGLDFIKEARHIKGLNKTPMIVVTGHSPDYKGDLCFLENVFLLTKPLEEETIEYYLGMSMRLRMIA